MIIRSFFLTRYESILVLKSSVRFVRHEADKSSRFLFSAKLTTENENNLLLFPLIFLLSSGVCCQLSETRARAAEFPSASSRFACTHAVVFLLTWVFCKKKVRSLNLPSYKAKMWKKTWKHLKIRFWLQLAKNINFKFIFFIQNARSNKKNYWILQNAKIFILFPRKFAPFFSSFTFFRFKR